MFLRRSGPGRATVPHPAQAHWRTFSGLLPLLAPHAEHGPVDGTNRPIFPKYRLYLLALYSSMVTNADHPRVVD